MNRRHPTGRKQVFYWIINLISTFSHNTSTGDEQVLYSYPFGMEDDYKDLKVINKHEKKRKENMNNMKI